jgi:hypothetical protein
MEGDTLKTPDTEGRTPVFVLRPAEFALDDGAACVEVAEAASLAGLALDELEADGSGR